MNNLKTLRKGKGLTQTDVARYIGISQNNYSYWENGKVKIDNDSLQKLADFFGVTVDYILGREEKSPPVDQEGVKIPDSLKPYQYAFFDGVDGLTDESMKDILKYIEFVKAKEKNKRG